MFTPIQFSRPFLKKKKRKKKLQPSWSYKCVVANVTVMICVQKTLGNGGGTQKSSLNKKSLRGRPGR